MTPTVQNTDTFLKARLAAYPDFDMRDYELLVRELDAVQQLYFERLRPETAVYTASVSSGMELTLSSLTPESGCLLEEEDLTGVSAGGKSLLRISSNDYHDGRSGCFTVYGGKLYLRPASELQSGSVTLFFRRRPAHLGLSGQNCTGSLFIPEKHLPMLFCKMKECIARLVGDDRDANLWAEAYNEWIDLLSSQAPSVCERAAKDAGGRATL